METKLEKKYGLLTAICMVVGIVIGSGVFFKAQDILNYTGGNMPLGILVYTIPKMLRAKLNGDTINTIATNWASNRIAAQAVIDSTINR